MRMKHSFWFLRSTDIEMRVPPPILSMGQDSSVSPESLLDQVPELIVPQDVLAQLLERDELLTPQQYLQAYHSPFNKHINSGRGFTTFL